MTLRQNAVARLVLACAVVVAAARTAEAASWYVDNGASGGDTGTSWADAWPTFAAISWGAGGVTAGDTLYISGGAIGASKIYTEAWVVGASGTAGSPITIAIDGANADHGGTVVFDYDNLVTDIGIRVSRDYITIDGGVGGVSHLTIRDMFIAGDKDAGRAISAGGSPTTGMTVAFVTFENVNNGIWLNSSGGVNAFSIHDNVFRQIKGDVVIGAAGSRGGFDANEIMHNSIELVAGGGGGPDGIQGSSGISVWGNAFKAVAGAPAVGQHPDYLQVTGDYLKVYGNDFVNIGDSGFDFDGYDHAAPHDIWIFNNVFRITDPVDTYPEYIRFYVSSGAFTSFTNIKILNNLFVDNTIWTPIRMTDFGGNPTGSGNQIDNNIFYNVGDGSSFFPVLHIDDSTGFTDDSFTFASNVYAGDTGTPYVSYNGTSYTAGEWVSSHDATGVTAAPLFTSYAAGSASNDYHLQATDTAATDTGVDRGTFFTTDLDGNHRPSGVAWDIGPLETCVGGACVATGCGDGTPDQGEACDDGNTADGDGCDTNCTLTACGNGVLTSDEECDDGNTADGDGCEADCTGVGAQVCGDNIISGTETCDDGNTVDGDGCDCAPVDDAGCGCGARAGGGGAIQLLLIGLVVGVTQRRRRRR